MWGQKWSVGSVPATSSSELLGHHINELCNFYSQVLHSSDRAGIVCLETHLFLPFPKLAFRAFDISFNFPSVRRMVPFLSLTLLLGIFTILLVSFISEDVSSALWAGREWDVRCEPPHSLLLKRTMQEIQLDYMSWWGWVGFNLPQNLHCDALPIALTHMEFGLLFSMHYIGLSVGFPFFTFQWKPYSDF